MKRLLIAATLTLAFTATPAMAAPIPHNDDNPDNWGAVYNLDLCNGEPCEVTATSSDFDVRVILNGSTIHQADCSPLSLSWKLDPHATVFDQFDQDGQGPVCPTMSPTTAVACVYSPSGFANGPDDIELWMRQVVVYGQGFFGKAPDDAIGNYVYRFDSYDFDQQTATEPNSPAILVFDATFEVDGDPVLVEHDRGATTCSYPELS